MGNIYFVLDMYVHNLPFGCYFEYGEITSEKIIEMQKEFGIKVLLNKTQQSIIDVLNKNYGFDFHIDGRLGANIEGMSIDDTYISMSVPGVWHLNLVEGFAIEKQAEVSDITFTMLKIIKSVK